MLCAKKADKMFMRTVQQNEFLILNRVPVTFVTDPELIVRPSIPVMTRSLVYKVYKVYKERPSVKKCDC